MWGRADPFYNRPRELNSYQLGIYQLANANMSSLSRQIQDLKGENQFFGDDDDDENRWDLFGLLLYRYKKLISENNEL